MLLKESVNVTLALLETRDMACHAGPREGHGFWLGATDRSRSWPLLSILVEKAIHGRVNRLGLASLSNSGPGSGVAPGWNNEGTGILSPEHKGQQRGCGSGWVPLPIKDLVLAGADGILTGMALKV